MRIAGGSLRGLKLVPPPDKATRPTTDRVREALFNILAHDPDWAGPAGGCPSGLNVLDVFAGTGALGLEAWSRGAESVAFIENDPAALAILTQNAARVRLPGIDRIRRHDAMRPGRAPRPFDLILMDAPYGQALPAMALQALQTAGWLAPDARCVVELERRDTFECPPGFTQKRRRDYGRTRLLFLNGPPG